MDQDSYPFEPADVLSFIFLDSKFLEQSDDTICFTMEQHKNRNLTVEAGIEIAAKLPDSWGLA